MALGIAAVEASGDAIAYLDGFGQPLMPTQGICEQQRGRDAGRVVAGRLHRLFEVVVPVRLAGAELGQTELEQHAAFHLW